MTTNGKSSMQLPIIDVSHPTCETAAQIIHAAAEYGFFYIRSRHLEIDAKTVNGIFDLVSFSVQQQRAMLKV